MLWIVEKSSFEGVWITFSKASVKAEFPQGNVEFCRIIVTKKRLKSKKADHGFFLCVKNLANSGFDSLFCLISIIYYKEVGFLCH